MIGPFGLPWVGTYLSDRMVEAELCTVVETKMLRYKLSCRKNAIFFKVFDETK